MKWICFISLYLLILISGYGNNYSLGRDPTWFPLDLKEKNANVNLFINLLFEKFQELRNESFTFIEMSPLDIIEGLKKKKYDGILTTLLPSHDIFSEYDFSDLLLFLGNVLVLPLNSSSKELSDLCGKIVGISAYDSTAVLQKYPFIIAKPYENMASSLEDLSQGRLDGVIMDVLDAKSIISHLYPSSLRIENQQLNDQGIRLMVKKNDHHKMMMNLNLDLHDIKKNGHYEEVHFYAFPYGTSEK